MGPGSLAARRTLLRGTREHQHHKRHVVAPPDAGIEPRAVMVQAHDGLAAAPAVPRRLLRRSVTHHGKARFTRRMLRVDQLRGQPCAEDHQRQSHV